MNSMPLRFCCSLLCLALAACEARVNVELAAADLDGVAAVHVALEGVDLLDENGSLHMLHSNQDDTVDLRELVDGQSLLLVDSAEVEADRYTGLRLRFADTGHSVERNDDSDAELTIDSADAFTDIDVDIGEDDTATVLATLDLRFSLRYDSSTDTYTLVQVLRAVDADSAASLTGTLTPEVVESSSCRQGRVAGTGVAVYLFDQDANALVDYRHGLSGPVASARVQTSSGSYYYDLANLAPGTYTVAWTCDADAETPEADNDLTFQSSASITLTKGEAQVLDF